jgi:hypothetical protein
MSDDTHRRKSRLQRLDLKAWIGYLIRYRSSNIYRIWIPSLAKVISTRDVTFDEQTVFDGKTEDLYDNLMHTTLKEIAALIRTLELLSPVNYLEAELFFKDDSSADTTTQLDDSDPPRYHEGRSVELYEVDGYCFKWSRRANFVSNASRYDLVCLLQAFIAVDCGWSRASRWQYAPDVAR